MLRLSVFVLLLSLVGAQGAWGFGRKPANPDPVPPSQPADPTPDVIRARWESSQRDGGKWSQYVFDQLPVLGKDLIGKTPADITAFCPGYKNNSLADKKNFWVYLVSAMSELESGHNPDSKYTENFTDAHGRRVVSRGLLQISIESGNGYGCGFKNEQELHDPYKNLACGLRILNRWIGKDGVISGKSGSSWRGGARYWAVLRNKLTKIQGWVKVQDVCR
jgi:hypothetical protein